MGEDNAGGQSPHEPLTLDRFRELMAHLPGSTRICYHSYNGGCALTPFKVPSLWIYPKDGPGQLVVINPGGDYDGRIPRSAPDRTEYWSFEVQIYDCTYEQAERVLRERLGHDEDCGFNYRINW